MNSTQTQMPQMKASDADRDAVLAALSEHFQAGRLTSDELDERTGRALAARTQGELRVLMTDLPTLQRDAPVTQVPAAPLVAPHYRIFVPVVAILICTGIAITSLASAHTHGWELGLVIPIALVARRLAGRRIRYSGRS
jgi:hypothetical protein